MSKFDKVPIDTKLVISPDGVRALRKWFTAGQIGYFKGLKHNDDTIIKVQIPGKDKYEYYADIYWDDGAST